MRDRSRRKFLALLSATGIAGAFGVGSASAVDSDRPEGIETFAASGKQIRRTKIHPEQVEVTQTVVSQDLDSRYGKKRVRFRDVAERAEPATDSLPQEDVRVQQGSWTGYYATEEDWQRLYDEGQRDAPVSGTEPAPSYATYEYKKDTDGGFAIAAPMNVLSKESIGPIRNVAIDHHYTNYVAQFDRYAFNTDETEFQTQHCSIAESPLRVFGGAHARLWEFGGWTSISAHVDSDVLAHSAISFLDAERDLESVFDDADGWDGVRDYKHLDNEQYLPEDAPDDHNGDATELVEI